MPYVGLQTIGILVFPNSVSFVADECLTIKDSLRSFFANVIRQSSGLSGIDG